MLIPKNGNPWRPFVDSLDKFSDDFMALKRNQGRFEWRKAVK